MVLPSTVNGSSSRAQRATPARIDASRATPEQPLTTCEVELMVSRSERRPARGLEQRSAARRPRAADDQAQPLAQPARQPAHQVACQHARSARRPRARRSAAPGADRRSSRPRSSVPSNTEQLGVVACPRSRTELERALDHGTAATTVSGSRLVSSSARRAMRARRVARDRLPASGARSALELLAPREARLARSRNRRGAGGVPPFSARAQLAPQRAANSASSK